jgi:DNA-binding NtrC family response regulator
MVSDGRICQLLIVDDDSDLCSVLAAGLRKICPVHIEHDLRSAEKYLAHEHPIIILLDNNLPDGLGVMEIKYLMDLYPTIKIVLMTADPSDELKEKAIHEGAVRFIAKPFRAAVINDLVLSVCPELRAA